MRHAVRADDGTPGGDFILIITNPDREPPLQDIPGFVIVVMDVERRLIVRRTGRLAGSSPFSEREVRGGGCQLLITQPQAREVSHTTK